MNDVCSIELLANAVANRLTADEEAALCEHLERCNACCARMEQLAGGEQWQQEAASLLMTDELDAAVPETMVWSEVDFSVEHLEPSEDANVLGQLGGYDVFSIIGRGGMGVVLKAFDRELKRFVAIKALSPHLAHSSVARKRFAREAQAAAAVVNPHVIAIHHVQPTGRLPFLIMPLLTGESLAQRLKSRAPLELTEVLRIGMQAAVGLAAAHDQGLVHRDVKPANIFLERGVERVVITDFGLARAADDVSMTRLGVVAGTPEYMSPEQARGEALDGRSDLFSLGCVLYEMATGVSPYRSDSTIATLRRIVDDKPATIASLAPELPPWFSHIVERLLSKDPAHRFASANEVSQLLEQCLSHLQQPMTVPLPACISALASKRYRRSTIGKFVAAAAGALAMLFAGILILLELDKGTLAIESEMDDVPIRIMQGDQVVKLLTVSKEGATTRIGAGKYIVEIGQEFDKAVVKEGSVQLSRGATEIIKVTRIDADKAESEQAKDEAAKAWLRRPVAGRTLDGKSFQLTGHDALMDCVMRNNSEALNRLLTMDKYDLDFSPRNGQWTLLQLAILHGCIETTSLLLRHGANPNFASEGTPLPLELAKRSGRKELVALVQKYVESGLAHQSNAGKATGRQLGTVLGKPIHLHERYFANQAELPGLLYNLFVPELEERYRKQHPDVEPTDSEIDDLAESMNAGFIRSATEQRKLLEAALLRKRQADPTSAEEVPGTQAFIEQVDETLKRLKTDRSHAAESLRKLKLQKHVYENYGGGRALKGGSQGLVLVDAQQRWFEERERLGEFQIASIELRNALNSYWTIESHPGSTLIEEADVHEIIAASL